MQRHPQIDRLTGIDDARQTGTATNVTADELSKIPTSRDPFSLLRSVPGVLVDRVNVGGNETGQQSNFASKGTRPQDAVWTMDGVAIT
ncbi:MAG TPA: TonB-dependent receptor plug domain-containing protein, partial [Vicinamibacterales bacterium]|nr:TonB-dependent receptor plug domain-containing protein [Vicinamibacterales bacterium]